MEGRASTRLERFLARLNRSAGGNLSLERVGIPIEGSL